MSDRKFTRRWRSDEIDALKRLRAEGLSLDEIASMMGRTKRSIQGKITDLKLPSKEKHKEHKCNNRCRACRFRGKLSNKTMCEYMDIMGESRKCPPGSDCTKYERGNPKKSHYRGYDIFEPGYEYELSWLSMV